MESEKTHKGVDYDVADVYLATIWGKDRLKREKIYKLISRKRSNHGRKPTISIKVLCGPIPKEGSRMKDQEFGRKLDEDEFLGEGVSQKWERYKGLYTEKEKNTQVAKFI